MEFKSEIQKISDNFYMISQKHVRSFLFLGENFDLLIDSCFGGDIYEAVKEVSDKPLKLVFTHCDRDHIGGEGLFDDKYIHPSEYSSCIEKNGFSINAKPLWEGDVINNGKFKFEIIHIPGHTPGSIALLERDKRFLIGGDSVQTGTIYMFGQGRSMQAFNSSMEKLIRIKDRFDRVYSSHNELEIKPETLYELRDFSKALIDGDYPLGEEAAGNMPSEIKVYRKGRVSFFLSEK